MRLTLPLLLGAAALAHAPAAHAQAGGPFTGPRAELLLGWDNLSGGDDDSDESADGLVYGGAIGYDMQFGGAIIGVEGEIAGSTADPQARNLDIPGDTLQLDAGRDLYVGGRLGFAFTPSTMAYAKLGYTNLRLDTRYFDLTGTVYDDGVTLDGWRAGAGLEHQFNALGPNAYVKAEYRYSSYSNLDFTPGGANLDVDVDRHQLLAGIGVRF